MRIAVLSDIHANAFALREVLREVDDPSPDEIWILGDIFGYYPWAVDTFELLQPYLNRTRAILGNHDLLLLRDTPPVPEPCYWEAAAQNRTELDARCPEALTWLGSLRLEMNFACNGLDVCLCHGTPDDPENGRYYPDDFHTHSWFPSAHEVLLLGQTHYPLQRSCAGGGTVINPGSMGQPRDGDPRAAWGIFDVTNRSFEFRRTPYDHLRCMRLLENLNWDQRAIAALNKASQAVVEHPCE